MTTTPKHYTIVEHLPGGDERTLATDLRLADALRLYPQIVTWAGTIIEQR